MTKDAVQSLIGYVWERGYPYLLAGLCTWQSLRLRQAQKLVLATELASPSLNVFAIIVGFVAAVVTFLLTAQGLPVLTRLKTTRAFHRLVTYHWEAVFWGFVASLISLAVLASCKTLGVSERAVLFHIWIFVGTASMLLFFRVFWLLKALLQPEDA